MLPTEPNTTAISTALDTLKGTKPSDAISNQFPALTKGFNPRLTGDAGDNAELAERLFRNSIKKGSSDPNSVLKSLSPQFSGALNMAMNQGPQAASMATFVNQLNEQLTAQLGKSFQLSSPLSTGLLPYDLVAPTQLIYPVYSPYRNLIPRTAGQGKAHEAKVLTSISGALPGQLGVTANRMSIGELPAGGSMTNWPNQLPGSGSQTAIDITVPYRFFGLTEAVSWLAQFAGQGFDDIAGLASLVLLQEMMVLEERAIISATSVPLGTPSTPTATQRAAGSGETPITGNGANVYIVVTAVNFYGETVASSAAVITTFTTGDVIDVTLPYVPGALARNIYVGTGSSAPANSGFHLMAPAVGGTRFTLQGALPTATATPPTADTGTSAATDYEGLISTITGHSAGTIYPAGYQGSYINGSVGDTLNPNVLNAALEGMWNGANGIFADPDDLWAEGTDLTNLANALANQSTSNYSFFVNQNEVQSARAGIAVREFVNPVTQKIVKLRVHPYYVQGFASLLSWTLPQPWTNVSNVWSNVMVQDYLSISWPVIDVTFRWSMFMYGTLFTPAVQYNGHLGGLQRSATTPYS